jgi:hypothetical protein
MTISYGYYGTRSTTSVADPDPGSRDNFFKSFLKKIFGKKFCKHPGSATLSTTLFFPDPG